MSAVRDKAFANTGRNARFYATMPLVLYLVAAGNHNRDRASHTRA
jgi:hypothetical protein